MVLASSNHASGFTPRPAQGLLREEDAPPRPDTYYGVAKVTMEALGSLYHDRYGMDVVCLRIGSAFPEPTTVRMLATWLSPADAVLARRRRPDGPAPGFSVVWGVSANTRNWWDLTAARALGYEPADDAEVYAEALIEAHGEPTLPTPCTRGWAGSTRCPSSTPRTSRSHERQELLATARAWADADPHAGDRAEIEALIEGRELESSARPSPAR